MRHQHLFDLDRSNIDAAGLDHFLDASAKIEASFGIEEAKIAGDEIAVCIEGGPILVCILVMAERYVALDAYLADLTFQQHIASLRVRDAQVDAGKRVPGAGETNSRRLRRSAACA